MQNAIKNTIFALRCDKMWREYQTLQQMMLAENFLFSSRHEIHLVSGYCQKVLTEIKKIVYLSLPPNPIEI